MCVAGCADAADGVERCHDGGRAGLNGGLERRQVEVAQPRLGQVDGGGYVVIPVRSSPVGGLTGTRAWIERPDATVTALETGTTAT